MNNQLGLKIVRISEGYTDLIEINGESDWTKRVWDIRKELETIDNLDGSSFVLMLSAGKTGNIVTLASWIGGRGNDCISAWIYIPANINIKGKELTAIIESVKNAIKKNTGDYDDLKQLFSTNYELTPSINKLLQCDLDKYAYRYYGIGTKYNLTELLDERIQPYYGDYKAVFLLDKTKNQTRSVGDNLSDKKLHKTIILNPPANVDGFAPFINDNSFKEAICAFESDSIEVKWRKNGYQTIITNTFVGRDSSIIKPTPNQYKRLIPYSQIKVVDQWNTPIIDYTLRIGNKEVTSDRSVSIPEATINQVKIDVIAEGYEPYSKCLDLREDKTIKLTKKIYEYQFSIPLYRSRTSHTFKLKSPEKISVSPIEGYVVSGKDLYIDRTNYLIFQPIKLFNWLTIVLIVIALSVGVCGGYFGCYYKNDVRRLKNDVEFYKKQKITQDKGTNTNTSTSQAQANTFNVNNDLDDAIKYLDKNTIWKLSEMEMYDDLKGLWRALNCLEAENILQYESKLRKSDCFKMLIKEVRDHKRYIPKGKTYNSPGDEAITYEKYIKYIKNFTGKSNNPNTDDERGQSQQNEWI